MLSGLKPTLYIQLSPQRVTVRNTKTREVVSEPPELPIERGARIAGFGSEARAVRMTDGKVVNPFAHPRSLVSDFVAGEQLLKLLVRRMLKGSFLTPAPRIVLHPQGNTEGGLTQVEIRAFREMALSAGASKVAVWQGRELTDRELAAWSFPAEGEVFE